MNIQQKAGGDKGAGEKAQNQQISERGAAFVCPGLNGEGGDFFGECKDMTDSVYSNKVYGAGSLCRSGARLKRISLTFR